MITQPSNVVLGLRLHASTIIVDKSPLRSSTLPTELVSGKMGEQTAQACAMACLQQSSSNLGWLTDFLCAQVTKGFDGALERLYQVSAAFE